MSQTRTHRSRTHRGRAGIGTLPDDLYAYAKTKSAPRTGRPVKHDPADWTVTDDWPDPPPVTEAEVDVFEAWFGFFSMTCSGHADNLRRRFLA